MKTLWKGTSKAPQSEPLNSPSEKAGPFASVKEEEF